MNLLRKYPQDIKLKIKTASVCFFANLAVFTVFRLLFFTVYHQTFAGLGAQDAVLSFICGLRYDISMIAMISGIFIFLLFLPFKSKAYVKIFCVLLALSFFATVALLFADFFYFPEVRRHMTEELISAWLERDFVVKYSLKAYWYVFIFLISGIIFTIKISFNVIDKNYKEQNISLWKSISAFLAAGTVIFICFRGFNFSGKTLSMEDVYKIENKGSNIILTLNGIFTQQQSLISQNANSINSYPADKAFIRTRLALSAKGEIFADDKYPLMRKIENPGAFKEYNIIIVLLESWTPRFIDSLSGSSYGVTPNFDEICQNGISFTNAYAIGTRSVYGMAATTVGVAMMPGMLVFSEGGLELNDIMSVPDMFNRKGYITMFTQPTPKKSQLTHNVYKNIFRFQEVFGQEDMALTLPYLQKIYFGYDYELLDFINEKASSYHKQNKPFFIYTFTGTSHMPFLPTTADFEKYPSDSMENKYLNNLYYTDYAIGNFINKAKKEEYFDNTVFFFIADHTTLTGAGDGLKTRFNIPFVIYAPKIFKPQKIDYTVSQADLIPTLYHLLNIDETFTASGKNALDPDSGHFAIMNDGLNIGYVSGDNFIIHNRKNVIDSSVRKGTYEYDEMESNLLALDKAITESFKRNKWYKK